MSGASDSAFLGVGRSITGRRWRSRGDDERLALALAQRLDVPDLIGRVLAARGVSAEDGDTFLNPTLRALLPDPSSLRDMDSASLRLAKAIMNGEQVAVFGDYDVDGATSSALLKRYVDAVGGKLTIYIPDRMTEGYGPNAPALLRLAEQGASLIVTVDCGTVAFAPLTAAAEAGVDVVVVDHHLAEPSLPPA
ncbi:MAG: DHH family phosphoesterase, partial [Minwuiales bacterium]|nr:DHH family phosphoesterase [Minwuiales bacterium]